MSRLDQVRELLDQGLSERKIAKQLGISKGSVWKYKQKLKELQDVDPAIREAMEEFGLQIEPDTIWIKNKKFSARVSKAKGGDHEAFIKKVQDAFADLPPAPQIEALPLDREADLMVTIPLFDVHFGLRAHAEISGEEVTLRSSVERFKRGVSAVIAAAPAAERCAIIIGGDLTHQTDNMNRTRRSGHILDVDGRNEITVDESIEAVAAAIEMALQKFLKVEVYGVPGNHDPQNYHTIMVALRERYRTHNRVMVQVRLDEFSVVEHGEVALYVHHGDKRTPKDLAMACAAKFPEVWGRTRYRVLLTGHLHHEKMEEFAGIIWRQMPAITPPDHHAAAGGYQSHSMFYSVTYDQKCKRAESSVML